MAMMLSLAGCQFQPERSDDVPSRDFRIQDLAKADVDLVVEIHLALSYEYLEALAVKLYKRNPVQLKRGGYENDMTAALDLIFRRGGGTLKALHNKSSTDAIHLALDPSFRGDRVLAYIDGLRSMLLRAYGGKKQFYYMDSFDPQKLYNAARNIEVAAWKLRHDRTEDGRLYLLSSGVQEGIHNYSFERLFGKLIALQDVIARIIADATNRQIKNVIQRLASAVFLPI